MREGSKIEWTDFTFNLWHGCGKKSPACKFCYAEKMDTRLGRSNWGVDAPRRFATEGYWGNLEKWNRWGERDGRIYTVFSNSMSDLFDIHPTKEINDQMNASRARYFDLVEKTPNLIYLLLTKEPGNIMELLPRRWTVGGQIPRNICFLTTIENTEYARLRLPELLKVPAKWHGVSMEPLLAPIDLFDSTLLEGEKTPLLMPEDAVRSDIFHKLDWVIVGGESGAKKDIRPMLPAWARFARDQVSRSSSHFFFKQWGVWKPWEKSDRGGWESQTGQNIELPAQNWNWKFEHDHGVVFERVNKNDNPKVLDGVQYINKPFPTRIEEALYV